MRQWCLLITLLFACVAVQAVDFNIESVLSPGELSQAHAKYDNDCTQCHTREGRQQLNDLCFACHKPVADDIAKGAGFHGRKPGIKAAQCKLCHSEHKGRGADILQLNKNAFVHDFTDFQLKGSHAVLACGQCHAAGKAFREAPGRCIDCHRDDDVHKGGQGEQCQSCHSELQWRKTAFDHRKTQFALTGAHEKVACAQCHRSADYKNTPKDCGSCHAIDDVHRGSFGAGCDSCHQTSAWKTTRFDHTRDGGFRLEGSHAQLACTQCHAGRAKLLLSQKQPLPQTCNGCHNDDDVHKGHNGTQCQQCHNNISWAKSRFDHNSTNFPLRGKHREARCEQCHVDDVHAPIAATSCGGCHQRDDVHKNAMGKACEQCHNEDGWMQRVAFDHDLTAFPLLGQHASVGCESCHASKQFAGTPSKCRDCHSGDDKHKGLLGTGCAQCHHPIGWASWHFDHDKQTRFDLAGAHAGLECAACHDRSMKEVRAAGKQCGLCHRDDDIHRGAYGLQCGTCHNATRFSDIQMR
jgi:hypothetical protein